MFEKPTVFILGAGASWHYNYPTGEDLVKRIVEKTEILIECFKNEIEHSGHSSSHFLPDFFHEKFNGHHSNIHALEFLKNFMSRIKDVDPPVIDYFLGWNEDLQAMGSLMIAWVILDCEREYIERGGNVNHERIQRQSPFVSEYKVTHIRNFKDNWYRFILYRIVSGCQTSADILGGNNVKFVTFNYDVSLERYLYRGLRAIKFLKENDFSYVSEFLEDRFIHVYGEVRSNPYDDADIIESVPSDKRLKNIKKIIDLSYKASKGIRTIDPHNKDNDEIQQKARSAIDWAEDVYILGYGFDSTNSGRLGLKDLLSLRGLQTLSNERGIRINKKVYFTNYGDRNSVNKKVSSLLTRNPNTFLSNKDAIFKQDSGSSSNRWSLYVEKSVRNVYDALEQDFDFL